MDVRQLQVLLAVAEDGTFSGAARRLHTVQSNVSTHIARLEQELGCSLVDRTNGHLTSEGEAVAARARRIQGELDAITPDLAAMHDEITGAVRIGVIDTVGRWLMPLLLQHLGTEYPLLHLHVAGATTSNLTPHVVEGSMHLALVNLPVDDPDLTAEPLFEEARVLAVPADSPLAHERQLRLDQLADIEVLVPPQGTAFRDEIDASLREVGVMLRTRAEIDGMGLLASVVASGLAPALLPASALPPGGTVAGVPVRDLAPRSVGLVSNRRVPPPATTRTVADVIRELSLAEAQRRPGLSPTSEHPLGAAT